MHFLLLYHVDRYLEEASEVIHVNKVFMREHRCCLEEDIKVLLPHIVGNGHDIVFKVQFADLLLIVAPRLDQHVKDHIYALDVSHCELLCNLTNHIAFDKFAHSEGIPLEALFPKEELRVLARDADLHAASLDTLFVSYWVHIVKLLLASLNEIFHSDSDTADVVLGFYTRFHNVNRIINEIYLQSLRAHVVYELVCQLHLILLSHIEIGVVTPHDLGSVLECIELVEEIGHHFL